MATIGLFLAFIAWLIIICAVLAILFVALNAIAWGASLLIESAWQGVMRVLIG